jgi:uncharacterized membrane protein YbhN (UPF0104 family)
MLYRYDLRCRGQWFYAVFANKHWVRLTGAAATVACLAWIFFRFVSEEALHRVSVAAHGSFGWWIGAAAAAYACGVVLLALGWRCLQRAFTGPEPVANTVSTYLITQMGKYLPGSVAQYVGRHMMLRRAGISHSALVSCAVTETALLGLMALLFAASVITRYVPWMSSNLVRFSVCTLLVTSILMFVRMRRAWPWLQFQVPVFKPGWVVLAFFFQGIFFALMSATLDIVASALPGGTTNMSGLAPAAAASWMAGYLVVGSPAGLGVREVVLIALLAAVQPNLDGVLAAAAFRVATFGGDALTFGFAYIWRSHAKYKRNLST